MNTILLPTDFSRHSEKALAFAIEIAKVSNAKIIVMHALYIPVMDINMPASITAEVYETEKKQIESLLKEYCQKISGYTGSNGQSLLAESVTGYNIPVTEIAMMQEKKKADLIIMGTEEEKSFLDFFSTTADVLNQVKCPLLIVKEDTPYKALQKIYLALEDVDKDVEALYQVIPLAKAFHAAITLVHVDKYPENMRELISVYDENDSTKSFLISLKERVNYSNIHFKHIFAQGAFDSLYMLVKNESPDLMALLKYERNWLDNIFHRSIIKHLIKETSTPILITHKSETH